MLSLNLVWMQHVNLLLRLSVQKGYEILVPYGVYRYPHVTNHSVLLFSGLVTPVDEYRCILMPLFACGFYMT